MISFDNSVCCFVIKFTNVWGGKLPVQILNIGSFMTTGDESKWTKPNSPFYTKLKEQDGRWSWKFLPDFIVSVALKERLILVRQTYELTSQWGARSLWRSPLYRWMSRTPAFLQVKEWGPSLCSGGEVGTLPLSSTVSKHLFSSSLAMARSSYSANTAAVTSTCMTLIK